MRRNGDLVALAGGLTVPISALIGISLYESKHYAHLYALHQHPALMDRSEMYATIVPMLGVVYLLGMGPIVYGLTERRKRNNSHGTI